MAQSPASVGACVSSRGKSRSARAKLPECRLREQQFEHRIGHDPGVANPSDGALSR
jgi:hypothetical protein